MDSAVLADDALKAKFAGVGEDLSAGALDMVVEPDAGRATLEELEQPVLTLGQWQWAHVDAVELKQVEGVQERHAIVLATMQALEVGDTRPIADHKLAVDCRVLDERLRSRNDQRIAVAPIVAPAGEQAHAAVTPADDQQIAVVLDFVNPLRSDGGLWAVVGMQGSTKPTGRRVGASVRQNMGGNLSWRSDSASQAEAQLRQKSLNRSGANSV